MQKGTNLALGTGRFLISNAPITCNGVAALLGSVDVHRLQDLGEMLQENTQSVYGLQGSAVSLEEGRLVYLSIPPSTYGRTARHVHAHLRPRVGRPWMRVVLEKPFGRDLESAEALSKELAEFFEEKEIYRVDHYLGKTVVKQMLPFRSLLWGPR